MKYVKLKCLECSKEWKESTLIEFCDRQCPYCKRWCPEIEIIEVGELKEEEVYEV